MKTGEIKNIEIRLLLEAMRLRYGYDFRNYAADYVARRVKKTFKESGLKRISEMIPSVLHDPKAFEELAYGLSITVTEMFRGPSFYLALRQNVMPVLKKYHFIKIWHAGCASGEEVYSMAIMLKEEGLYDRTRIYATDFNAEALAEAKEGVYAIKNMKKHTVNYQKAGGRCSFGDYYHSQYDAVIMNESLKKNIIFSHHNLATDVGFSKMHLIICRNVMIYFDIDLHNRVFHFFKESLMPKGFLCLGKQESICFYERKELFKEIVGDENILQLC